MKLSLGNAFALFLLCIDQVVVSNGADIPADCRDVLRKGHNTSGEYEIKPLHFPFVFKVYCDMATDGGGWTVIQRRGQFGNPEEFFYLFWHHYKNGFGDLKKEFWLGNDKISSLSRQNNYVLRFDLKDVEGEKRHAIYDEFWIEEEEKFYKLHVSMYSGNAVDSFTYHNGMKFSTKDRDNDLSVSNCAFDRKSGWWHNTCTKANLNGRNLKGPVKDDTGITWYEWKGYFYSLLETEMKIRPK